MTVSVAGAVVGRHWRLGDRTYRVLEAVGAMVGGCNPPPAPLWLGKGATECAQLSPLLGIVVSERELSDPIREVPGAWGSHPIARTGWCRP